MNFIKLVINLIKKDYNKIDKQGALLFFVKFFVHIVFNRQLRNIRKKPLQNLEFQKKNFLLKNKFRKFFSNFIFFRIILKK